MEEGRDCLGDGAYYDLKSGGTGHAGRPTDTVHVERETRRNRITGEEYCIAAITEALSNEDSYIRLRAVSELGATGDLLAVRPLISALQDTARDVRDRAYKMLLSYSNEDEPLPVRVLLSEELKERERAELMLAISSARLSKRSVFEINDARKYCQNAIAESDPALIARGNADVWYRLKRNAASVIREIDGIEGAKTLLRAGDWTQSPEHDRLLRSAAGAPVDGSGKELVRPSMLQDDTIK